MKESIWRKILNGEQVLPKKPNPTPKFNLWDKVYILRDSKIQEVTVCGIYSFEDSKEGVTLHLQFRPNTAFDDMLYRCPQDKAFATKEELIASL